MPLSEMIFILIVICLFWYAAYKITSIVAKKLGFGKTGRRIFIGLVLATILIVGNALLNPTYRSGSKMIKNVSLPNNSTTLSLNGWTVDKNP